MTSRLTTWGGGVLVAVLAVLSAGAGRAQDPADLTPREKTAVFIQHLVKVAKIDPSRYRALVLEHEIGEALLELAGDPGAGAEPPAQGALGGHGEVAADHGHEAPGVLPTQPPPALAPDFIGRALEEIHPEYAEAVKLRRDGKLPAAKEAAGTLAAKPDPYLGAYARLLLAEVEFEEGAAGADRELLDRVVALCERIGARDRLYLIRDYQACELIARAFAVLKKPLHEYLQHAILLTDYPGLPPEVEARAKARLASLEEEAGKPLGTVASWMNRVEKHLAGGRTGPDPTQAEEAEVASALDKLIALQEARERKTCSGCGSGNCRGGCQSGRPRGNRSMTPARVSALAEAEGEVRLRGVSRGDPSGVWGLLKERDAARALQSFKGKLPARYERLLEQYYKNLSHAPGE